MSRGNPLRVSRRGAIAGLVALPLTASRTAWAQGLIDPASLRSSRVGSPADNPAPARPDGMLDPSYARDMAGSVVSAILSLINSYASVAGEIGKLEEREKKLSADFMQAVRDRDSKLEEYRQGLFCSGCGKTRSEILAKGEQFPHPGQTIIRPTPEQIAAKEKELQGVIDRLAEELKKAKARKAELEPDIGAIREQLFAGTLLWSSATAFERRLIRQGENVQITAYTRERARIDEQLALCHKDARSAQGEGAIRRTLGDFTLWVDTLQRTEKRRADERARADRAFADNVTLAKRQINQVDVASKAAAAKITAFGLAGHLQIFSSLMSPNQDPVAGYGGASGYNFRMGKYDKAGFGEILPRVAEFLARARAMQPGILGSDAPSAATELARAGVVTADLQRKLALIEAAAEQVRRQQELERQQQQSQQDLSSNGN